MASELNWYCETCGRVGADHYLKKGSDSRHTIREVSKPGTYEADFTPNKAIPVEQHDMPPEENLSIAPPMTAKEFRAHCKAIAENKEKPMATRLVAFGLGAFVEGVTDGVEEILGGKKRPAKRRLKK